MICLSNIFITSWSAFLYYDWVKTLKKPSEPATNISIFSSKVTSHTEQGRW
jgi:hypothetical protein